MRFRLDDSVFRIVFRRERKDVEYTTPDGQRATTLSKNPFTTVFVYRDKDGALPGEVFRTATVGCSTSDTYTAEEGRKAALRAISKTLDKPFKRELWGAYILRPRPKSVQKPASSASGSTPSAADAGTTASISN